jgi:hypothetical protein
MTAVDVEPILRNALGHGESSSAGNGQGGHRL